MKTTIYKKVCGWLAAAMVLTTTSCKDDLFNFGSESSDEVTVSFTLAPEAAVAMTRGTTTPSGDLRHPGISGGEKVDMLIYAVYDPEDNYALLEGYSNGTDDELKALGFDHGDGQTIKKIPENGFPYTVNITLKKGKQYTIAFWAQSSKTDAYNTADLRKVEVKYKRAEEDDDKGDGNGSSKVDADGNKVENFKALNNDEARDAFCNQVTFKAGEDGLEQNVFLYRPLAQINVGTRGYDYELVTRGVTKKYTYSKIRINKAARYLDVAKDKVYFNTTEDDPYGDKNEEGTPNKAEEAFTVIDFDYAPIPAYIDSINKRRIPDEPSYTLYDWKYKGRDHAQPLDDGTKYDEIYDYEEFLKVKNADYRKDGELDSELGTPGEEFPALTDDGYIDYANTNNYEGKVTDIYKYLSMCYVLTASSKEKGDVLGNVKLWLATDAEGTDEIEVFNIDNVPAQRNWRTNIVGDLLTEKSTITVSMDKNFAGEYNGWFDGDKWIWTGQIADGVYYDAMADEIQISNKNGLIWLQQMVNGKLTVRESQFQNGAQKGNQYVYYKVGADGKETTEEVPNKYIDPQKLSDDVLRRIIKASHIEDNKTLTQYNGDTKVGANGDIKWPNYYSFNFYGAKVKLMADIDLSDEEWIPIGFDCSVHDTSAKKNESNASTLNYTDFNKTQGSRRAFCGTFDGNGHTIYNLKNMRFTAKVHDKVLQYGNGKDTKPYDNVQWMPSGLFGMIGDGATIKNLKLVNADLYGYHTAGAIAGIAFSLDANDPIVIDSCTVDGSSIVLSPMLRGDNGKTSADDNDATKKNDNDYYRLLEASRTYARGIYAGGIIGHMVARNTSKITNCAVRNTTIRAYRRVGGILGSISNSEQKNDWKDDWDNDNWQIDISNNALSNVLIIADKFQPYHRLFHDRQTANGKPNVWKNGYGWNASQAAYAGAFVGGFEENSTEDAYYNKFSRNQESDVKLSEFATNVTVTDKERTSTIKDVPLNLMPMLSSWFTDAITLKSNFYGASSAKTVVNTHNSAPWQRDNNYTPRTFFYDFPMKLPYDLSIDYNGDAPNAGIFVESVRLDGNGNTDGSSVITANDVSGGNACVMFVTARNFKEFITNSPVNVTINDNEKTRATVVRNLVLRGNPYAWAGVLISPNENMSKVEFDNVSIYDVYQTVTLNPANNLSTGVWPKSTQTPGNVALEFKNSNWRGYTNIGDGWKSVTYENMVFGAGLPTKAGNGDEYKTLKVGKIANDGTTAFEGCIFKAPYIIEIPEGTKPTFDDECKATAAAPDEDAGIHYGKIVEAGYTCTKIEITSNAQGHPQVAYYVIDPNDGKMHKYDKDGNQID